MKVVIAGAGIAGLALAKALVARGHRVSVIDAAKGPRPDSFALDVSGIGHVALERLGLLARVEPSALSPERLVFHGQDGSEIAEASYAALRGGPFRGRHVVTTRGELEAALYETVKRDIDVAFGVAVDEIAVEGPLVRLQLSDGSSPAADLFVGADGVRSTVRAMMFGRPEATFRRFLGYRALAFVADDERLAAALGPALRVMAMERRQITVLPLAARKVACLLVHRADEAPALTTRQDALSELQAMYGRVAWVMPVLIEHAERGAFLHFDGVCDVHLPHWSVGPIALIGDAAHGISLLAGHGASLALASAVAFADELDRDPIFGPQRFERRMRPVVEAVQRAGRDAGPWLVPDNGLALLRHRLASRFARLPFASHVVRGAAASAAGWNLG